VLIPEVVTEVILAVERLLAPGALFIVAEELLPVRFVEVNAGFVARQICKSAEAVALTCWIVANPLALV